MKNTRNKAFLVIAGLAIFAFILTYALFSGVVAPKPVVVAVEMGYGHLRAAMPLAEALGTEVLHVDRPPLVAEEETRLWRRVRRGYEAVSRLSQLPVAGRPLRWLLDEITDIPRLHPYRDLSAPTRGVLTLERLARRNLGQGLVAHLRETGAPLLTTQLIFILLIFVP